MNEIEESRPIATAGTGATQERVDIQVSAGEHISIPVCPACGMPLLYGHFGQWTQSHYWWCRHE